MSCFHIIVLVWGKYLLLGEVYELDDYKTPSDEVVKKFQAIIDEAFGRTAEEK